MRLDRYLSQSGERSRSESARLLRAGLVRVNGQTVRDGGFQVGERDEVLLRDAPVEDSRFLYLMLNKPAGLLTASRDSRAGTVMELLPEGLSRRKVAPVGRLDKDTTGLLLLTNDGALAHQLLSPKRHVWKRYAATVEGRLAESACVAFEAGVPLADFTALPARLTILRAEDEYSQALAEVREGKYHQVKRMFLSVGHPVVTLCRVAFGPLLLPEDLLPGAYRALTETELFQLRQSVAPETLRGAEEKERHG